MRKYYLIPLTDRAIYLNEKPLETILKEKFPKLYKREEERIDILYSNGYDSEIPRERLDRHNEKTKEIYEKMQIPEYIIACGNDKSAKEVITGIKLSGKYPAALGVRKTSKERLEEYYRTSNYSNKIINYINVIRNINDVAIFLEGNIDGKPVKGEFIGTIKVKKIGTK